MAGFGSVLSVYRLQSAKLIIIIAFSMGMMMSVYSQMGRVTSLCHAERSEASSTWII